MGFRQEEDDPVFVFPSSYSTGRFQKSSKARPSDSALLSQGAFSQAEPLNREFKTALPPIGQQLFCTRRDQTQDFPTCCLQERQFSLPSPSLLLSLNFLLREGSAYGHASLSLNMWGSKFLASMIVEEASKFSSSFITSLESVVRSFLTPKCCNSLTNQPHGWNYPPAQRLRP